MKTELKVENAAKGDREYGGGSNPWGSRRFPRRRGAIVVVHEALRHKREK